MPSQLQAGEWVVEDVDGQGIVDSSHGTLNFTADGKVTGRSFCNSYNGSYTVTGNSLTIGRLASTKMACPPASMNLETRFSDVLAAVSRFELSANGALVLHADDGRTITARRQ